MPFLDAAYRRAYGRLHMRNACIFVTRQDDTGRLSGRGSSFTMANRGSEPPPTPDSQRPQTRSQIILRTHFAELVQYINLNSLQPHLESNGLLTTHLSQVLQLPGLTDIQKKTSLLSTLLHDQQDFIDKLILSLRGATDHCEHERLADLLGNTDYQQIRRFQEVIRPSTVLAPGLGENEPLLDPEVPLVPNRTSFCGVLHAVCCKALIAYLCALILLLLLSLIPIVPTAHWYQENVKGYSVLNSMNQTVVAPLEQHLYSISLQHNFTLTPCTLQTVAVPCNELKPNHTTNVSDPNFFSGKKNEFLYLLNMSVINLHYDISTDSDATSVAFWVFNNLTDYKSANAKVRSINCTSNHPRDGWPKCQKFTTKALNKSYMLNYTVLAEHDSFYYLLCQQTTVTYGKQSCNSQYFLPSIDVYWYNFSIYNRGNNVNTGSITTEKSPLILRKSFDPSLYISEPKKCLLMHTPDWGSCESQTNGIVVTVSDIVKVNDVGFFAGIALVFLLMVYIVVTLSIHVCLYRRERRRQLRRPHQMDNQVRPGQPAANSTGVPG